MRIQRTRKLGKKRSGFTLLELLLVMAILVVLASLATVAVLSMQRNALRSTALLEIKTLSKACKMYKLQVYSFPAKLEDLHTLPSGLDMNSWGGPYVEDAIDGDPWHRPYQYSPDDANDVVMISSSGPDGQSGTDDDVPDLNKRQ